MMTADSSWYMENEKQTWLPVMNSWGMPYRYKGFAINKAKSFLWRWSNHNAHAYVIEQATSKIVWCSWDDED